STGPVAFSADGNALATAGPPYAGRGVDHPIALLGRGKRHSDLSWRQDWEEPAPPTAEERREMLHGTPIKLWRLDAPQVRAFTTELPGVETGDPPSFGGTVSADNSSLPEGTGQPSSSAARWILLGGLALMGVGCLWLLIVRRYRYSRLK